jgi:hypothetical protein
VSPKLVTRRYRAIEPEILKGVERGYEYAWKAGVIKANEPLMRSIFVALVLFHKIVLALLVRLVLVHSILMETNANIEPELNSLRTKLAVEIENDAKQIEMLKRRITKNSALLNAVRGSLGALHPESRGTRYGGKLDMIRDAIAGMSVSQFTPDDVESALRRRFPGVEMKRQRLRTALWTLASKKNGIRAVSKGNNHEPAVYEKTDGVTRWRRTTEQDSERTLRRGAS